jgi:hypothetical protein
MTYNTPVYRISTVTLELADFEDETLHTPAIDKCTAQTLDNTSNMNTQDLDWHALSHPE